MKLDEARNLAVKLFGLFCAARFAVFAPQVFSIFFMSSPAEEFVQNRFVVALASSLAPVLYLGLAWACLFRTRVVCALLWAGEPQGASSPPTGRGPSSFAFWITLVGFFYLVSSTAGLLSQLWIFGVDRQMVGSTFLSAQFLPNIFLFPLSLFCILKARRIEEFIVQKQATQQTPAGDVATRAAPEK